MLTELRFFSMCQCYLMMLSNNIRDLYIYVRFMDSYKNTNSAYGRSADGSDIRNKHMITVHLQRRKVQA